MIFSEALFLSVGCTLWAAGAYALYRASDGLVRFTIPNLFFVFYTLFIFLGSFGIFFEHRMDSLVFAAAFIAPVVLVPAGVLTANAFFRFHPREELTEYLRRPVENDAIGAPFVIAFLLLLSLGVLASFLYLHTIGTVPSSLLLKGAGRGNYLDLLRSRDTSLLGGDPIFSHEFGYYAGFIQGVLPFLAVVAFTKALVSVSRRWWLLFALVGGLTCFMLVNTLIKSTLLVFMVMILVAYSLVRRRPPRGELVAFVLVAVGYLVAFYYLLLRLDPYGNIWHRTFNAIYIRTALTYPNILYTVIDVFPRLHPFLVGSTLPNPHGVFPFGYFNLALYVGSILHPPTVGSIVVNAPTAFFAEVYANFGPVAMLLSMPVAGFILQAIQILLTRQRKTILSVALTACVTVYAATVAYSYFLGVLTSWYFILIVASFGLLKALSALLSGPSETSFRQPSRLRTGAVGVAE